MRGDLKFNPPPGVSFRSHGLFALRERTIVKRRTFASLFSLRSFSERGKKERARDQFKEISKRGDHFQKGNRKSASLCALSFVSVREKTDDEREEEEELLRFRVGSALRDERGGAQLPSSSSSSETTRLLTAFFQKNRARKKGKSTKN